MVSPSFDGRRGTVAVKTDRRSNSYKPTVGPSIELGADDAPGSRMNAGERMNKNVERGRATRAHVVDVATRLFAEHGYDGTSIETVQASAGVSRGSLYHHFPGKEALFWAGSGGGSSTSRDPWGRSGTPSGTLPRRAASSIITSTRSPTSCWPPPTR